MKTKVKIPFHIFFALAMIMSIHAMASVDESRNVDEPWAAEQKVYKTSSELSADDLYKNIEMVLNQNVKYHRHGRDYNLIRVNDKIGNKYQNTRYWVTRYFRYDVDTQRLFGVKLNR
jgi:hypothetical protein